MLGEIDVKALVRDLADDIAETGAALALKERLEEVCGHARLPYERARRPPLERPRK